MFIITTLKNQRAAIEHYLETHNVDDFVFDNLVFDY